MNYGKESLAILKDVGEESDRIARVITTAIKTAQNTPITVRLTKEDAQILAAHRQAVIESERKLIDNHAAQFKAMLDQHLSEIDKTLEQANGIHLTGWLTKAALWTAWILYGYVAVSIAIFIALLS